MVEKEFRKASRYGHFHKRPKDPAQPRDPKRRFGTGVATRGKPLKHLADHRSCTRGSFYCRLRIELTPNRKGVYVVLPKGVAVDHRVSFAVDLPGELSCTGMLLQVLDKVRYEIRLCIARSGAHP